MKYALVTGATSGLGDKVASELAQMGWSVFACGRNENALKDLKNSTYEIPIKMDVTDQASIDAAYEEVCKQTDHLDAIINFSGVQKMGSLIESDVKLTEDCLKVNLLGMVRVNKTFFPLIEKCHGRIINCSSECGWMTPQPFNGPYTLSKYAVEAYNDSLRRCLDSILTCAPGEKGSLTGDPAFEATFGWQQSDVSMTELKGKLLNKRLVRCLSSPPEELRQLREMGVCDLHIGIESGSDSILLMMNKGVTSFDMIQAFQKLDKAGIGYYVTIILGLGGKAYRNLHALEKNEMYLTHWNLINPDVVLGHEDVIVKIRYRKQANRCTVTLLDDQRLHIQLHEPLASIASGQAAAFYRGNTVLGGGIIE